MAGQQPRNHSPEGGQGEVTHPGEGAGGRGDQEGGDQAGVGSKPSPAAGQGREAEREQKA